MYCKPALMLSTQAIHWSLEKESGGTQFTLSTTKLFGSHGELKA